jgi:hypothetical protein
VTPLSGSAPSNQTREVAVENNAGDTSVQTGGDVCEVFDYRLRLLHRCGVACEEGFGLVALVPSTPGDFGMVVRVRVLRQVPLPHSHHPRAGLRGGDPVGDDMLAVDVEGLQALLGNHSGG